MTQDLTVQNQRPSAMPYVLGGTAAGALAGWGASKIPALQGAKYNSWQDILKDSADDFKKMTEAAGENETLKNGVEAVKTAAADYKTKIKEALKDAVPEFDEKLKGATEFTKRNDAIQAMKTKYAEVLEQVKNGGLGFDKKDLAGDDLTKAAKKYIKENMDKEDFKALKEALDGLKNANKNFADKAKELGVKSNKQFSKEVTDKIKTAADDAWNAVKDKVKDFKEPRTKALLIGGAVAGLLLGALLRPKAKEQA